MSKPPKTKPGPTIQDLFDGIEKARFPRNEEFPQEVMFDGSSGGLGWTAVNYVTLRTALEEIVNKLPAVEAKLDEFTACEKLMFLMLRNHSRQCHGAVGFRERRQREIEKESK